MSSVIVVVVAAVAKSIVMLLGTSASVMEAQVRLPLAAIVVAKVLAAQSVGLVAKAVAVAALPPMLRLATGVVEATTNGAVPVANVEVN